MKKAIYCKRCGMMINYERTVKGKYMPVDTPSVWYKPDSNGKDTILSDTGETVRGWILEKRYPDSLRGHRPHFISCAGYRKEAKQKNEAKEEQMTLFPA